MSIVGARPQFIKLAAICQALDFEPSMHHCIVHSGQHYNFEMSGQFFDELVIPKPDYNLEVGSGHHIYQMAKCMMGLVEIFEKEKPDIVLVYGDTNTTSAAAIAASKCNIKIAHIEAGLREFDKTIPEEVNKLITDSVTDLYFTPTETGRENLEREGKVNNVFVTGDISLDLLYSNRAQMLEKRIHRPYIFMTCHRAANTNDVKNLDQILRAVSDIDRDVIFAVHPRTKNALAEHFSDWHPAHVEMINPSGFWETQAYIKFADFVITDSGGIIKEAYFHKVPAIIIDKQTEWIETVDEGWNVIAGPDKEKILSAITNWKKPNIHSNCLGDGMAGEKIIDQIILWCEKNN